MHHQGVGGQGEQLVEDEEGEQVAGKGDAQGGTDTQAEEAEEAVAVGGVLQIADGVESGQEPQHRRQPGQEQRQGIAVEDDLLADDEREPYLGPLARGHLPDQDRHHNELQRRPH